MPVNKNMVTTTTMRRFEELRGAILSDNEINSIEVDVLLDFIRPYCNDGIKCFGALQKALEDCRGCQELDSDQMGSVMFSMDAVSSFLKRKSMVERAITAAVGVSIVAISAYFLLA